MTSTNVTSLADRINRKRARLPVAEQLRALDIVSLMALASAIVAASTHRIDLGLLAVADLVAAEIERRHAPGGAA